MVDGFFSSIQGTDLKEKLAYSPHALYLVFLFSLGNRGHNVTWCMGTIFMLLACYVRKDIV